MMSEENNNLDNLINFGTYSASDTEILKSEFEKNGISVKVRPTYTLFVPVIDLKKALEIRKKLSIKAKYKIPLLLLLYKNINRYLFRIILFAFIGLLLLGIFGVEETFYWTLLVDLILFAIVIFFIVSAYKVFKKWKKGVE